MEEILSKSCYGTNLLHVLKLQIGTCCRFLRMCPGLSRQLIGDILGENNERCLRVLECFTASFDFSGMFEADAWCKKQCQAVHVQLYAIIHGLGSASSTQNVTLEPF